MKAVKVAVSTAMRDVSAAQRGASAALRGMLVALRGVLAALRGVSAALRGVSATPCGMLAGQDTPGAWGTLGGKGGVLYMKNFYGLELLKNHF